MHRMQHPARTPSSATGLMLQALRPHHFVRRSPMATQTTGDQPAAVAGPPAPPALKYSPWLVLFTLCLGFFMILLDTTIVNIAIPNIIDKLGASLDQILWILNAYILVY